MGEPSMTPRREKPETVRQRAIVKALEATGRMVLRIQSGSVPGRRGWIHLAPKGTPDLLVIGWGFLEVKVGDGKLSPEQVVMHERIRRAGVRVAVVRSAAEALRAVISKEGCP
jgi:hypothetical protein